MRRPLTILAAVAVALAAVCPLRGQVLNLNPTYFAQYYWNASTVSFVACPTTVTAEPFGSTPQAVVPAGFNASLGQWTPATTCNSISGVQSLNGLGGEILVSGSGNVSVTTTGQTITIATTGSGLNLEHNGTPLTDQGTLNFEDAADGSLTPPANMIPVTWVPDSIGGLPGYVPTVASQLNSYITPPRTDLQYCELFPTTAAGSGALDTVVSSYANPLGLTPGGGGIARTQAPNSQPASTITWGGFDFSTSCPGISASSVQYVYVGVNAATAGKPQQPEGWAGTFGVAGSSTPQGAEVLFPPAFSGDSSANFLAGSYYGLFSGGSAASFDYSAATITASDAATGCGFGGVCLGFQQDSINAVALFAFYTGTTVPQPGVQVACPLYFNPATDTLGISWPWDFTFDTGSANLYAATVPCFVPQSPGTTVSFFPANNNTSTAPTFAYNGGQPVTIVKNPGYTAVAASDMVTTAMANLKFDGTYWILLDPQTGGSGTGVTGLNSLTGGVTIAPGAGIGVSTSTPTITITNIGVTGLNSLDGNINITAGSGISVTPSGSSIAIAATGSGSGQQPVTYTVYNNSGTITAINGLTGATPYTSTDAAVVFNDIFSNNENSGGTIFVRAGIYNINSATQETVSPYTLYYGIGITAPSSSGAIGAWYPTWNIIGESATTVFNVTTAAETAAGSGNTLAAFWMRPTGFFDPLYPLGNLYWNDQINFTNITIQFQANTRGNEYAIDALEAQGGLNLNNVVASFVTAPSALGATNLEAFIGPANPNYGFQANNSFASQGWTEGFSVNGEHSLMSNTSTWRNTVGYQYGEYENRNASVIYHSSDWVHPQVYDDVHGITTGSYLASGSQLDILGLDIEYITTGTWAYADGFTTTANLGGFLSWTNTETNVGRGTLTTPFTSGSGGLYQVENSGNAIVQNLSVLGACTGCAAAALPYLKQYTYVANVSGSSASITSPSITYAVGDTIAVVCSSNANPSITVTDSNGNTWNQLSGISYQDMSWSQVTNASIAGNFTCTPSSAQTNQSMTVLDFAGTLGTKNTDSEVAALVSSPWGTSQRTLNIFCANVQSTSFNFTPNIIGGTFAAIGGQANGSLYTASNQACEYTVTTGGLLGSTATIYYNGSSVGVGTSPSTFLAINY